MHSKGTKEQKNKCPKGQKQRRKCIVFLYVKKVEPFLVVLFSEICSRVERCLTSFEASLCVVVVVVVAAAAYTCSVLSSCASPFFNLRYNSKPNH